MEQTDESGSDNRRLLLVGCGVLQCEIESIIKKNGWPIDLRLGGSCAFGGMAGNERRIRSALHRETTDERILFMGECHPFIGNMVEEARAVRTEGVNCISMLLGEQRYMEGLVDGAYYLIEAWARNFRANIAGTFGENREIIREIFGESRSYILCIRTPCSGDFTIQAKEAGEIVGLPVRWTNVNLDHLESVLLRAMERRSGS